MGRRPRPDIEDAADSSGIRPSGGHDLAQHAIKASPGQGIKMSACSAAMAFENAKAAFDAGDFAAARAHAAVAEIQVLSQIKVLQPAGEAAPLCSIVILAQRDSDELDDLIAQLAQFIGPSLEVVLVINGSAGDVSQSYPHMTVIHVGFNYGCSGGRNIGARFSRGRYVLFLDDDGVLEPGAIESLLGVIERHSAVAVRGRVKPRSDQGIGRRHYDYGDEVIYSAPNTEGISIWRREEFLKFGGFDPLLAGHEGIVLWSKMFRFYGPDAFLYDPLAILHHDYAKDQDQLARKKSKLAFNLTYLNFAYPKAFALKAAMHRRRSEAQTRINFAGRQYTTDEYTPECSVAELGVTVLTVAKNVKPLLEDYTQALKNQTFKNFQVIFVDRGSADGTADQILALWKHDERLRLLKNAGSRAESLNLALAKATHDICVVAEAGDLSLPRRLEMTLRYFGADPRGWLSFAAFTETELFIGARAPARVGLRTRTLLRPPDFGTLSFRKAEFAVPFDVSLEVGCEGKWMRDNLSQHSIDGDFIPLHQVFRRSDEALTDAEPQAIRASELATLYAAHERLVGQLSEEDRWCCRVLGGFEGISAKDRVSVIERYIVRLIAGNAEKKFYDQTELQDLLASLKSQVERQKLRALNRKYKRELRRLRELCGDYERQLAELGGGPKKE